MSCEIEGPHRAHTIPLEGRQYPDLPIIGMFCSGGVGDLSVRVKEARGRVYLLWTGDSYEPWLYGVYATLGEAEVALDSLGPRPYEELYIEEAAIGAPRSP